MGSCPDTDIDPNLLDKPNRAGLFFSSSWTFQGE